MASNKQRLASLQRAAAKATVIPGSPYRWDDGINGQYALVLWDGARLHTALYLQTLDEILERWGGPGTEGLSWDCTGVIARAAWIAATTHYPEAVDFRGWFTANGWSPEQIKDWLSQPSTLLDLQRFERLAKGEADLVELNRLSFVWG